MSGPIEDMPVRVCECGATWIEDDQMYEDVDRCPGCGKYQREPEYTGKPDPDYPY